MPAAVLEFLRNTVECCHALVQQAVMPQSFERVVRTSGRHVFVCFSKAESEASVPYGRDSASRKPSCRFAPKGPCEGPISDGSDSARAPCAAACVQVSRSQTYAFYLKVCNFRFESRCSCTSIRQPIFNALLTHHCCIQSRIKKEFPSVLLLVRAWRMRVRKVAFSFLVDHNGGCRVVGFGVGGKIELNHGR
jgi:hypothetical protein